jgi:hypothetical protein
MLIILLLFLLIVILMITNEYEGFGNEALGNIASVFNVSTLYISDLEITGNATIGSMNILPSGSIVAWNTTWQTVPTGWLYCDGTNGTPDLRGKMIYGCCSASHNVNDVGGEENHTLTVAEMPGHTHGYNVITSTGNGSNCPSNSNPPCKTFGGGSAPTYMTYNSSSTGGGNGHNNMPPFHILSYIMKK